MFSLQARVIIALRAAQITPDKDLVAAIVTILEMLPKSLTQHILDDIVTAVRKGVYPGRA